MLQQYQKGLFSTSVWRGFFVEVLFTIGLNKKSPVKGLLSDYIHRA
jgi:hypothetical protein